MPIEITFKPSAAHTVSRFTTHKIISSIKGCKKQQDLPPEYMRHFPHMYFLGDKESERIRIHINKSMYVDMIKGAAYHMRALAQRLDHIAICVYRLEWKEGKASKLTFGSSTKQKQEPKDV